MMYPTGVTGKAAAPTVVAVEPLHPNLERYPYGLLPLLNDMRLAGGFLMSNPVGAGSDNKFPMIDQPGLLRPVTNSMLITPPAIDPSCCCRL